MTDQRHMQGFSPSQAQTGCQIQCLDHMPDPNAKVILPPLVIRLRLKLTRRMDQRVKRAILEYGDHLFTWFAKLTGKSDRSSAPATNATTTGFKAGDLVRVRSKEEIEATLNFRRQLRGCTFMEEMEPYCGTTQRILKPVERFLDERDYRVKRCRGIILLEGLLCQGTERFGRCDRSCFYFWREEWLQKVD